MIKGGRQAKLLAKENQAKTRAEKLFCAFNKESLKKLKGKIMPDDSKTPAASLTNGDSKAPALEKMFNLKNSSMMSKTIGRPSKPTLFL